ncbi:MAG: glycosyltransferase family 1 protein [Candidatus Gracilibacteria bacterium]
MKIGIDIRTAGGEKAGKGQFTFCITRELLKIDRENRYFLYTNSGIAGFEEFKNVEMVIIDAKGLTWHRAVMKDLKKQEIKIFFAPSSFIIPALLSKKSGIKTIITIHDLVSFIFPATHDKKARLIEKIFLKRAIKKATALTTVSENTKRDIIEKFGLADATSATSGLAGDPADLASEKIQIIPCAASEDFSPVERSEEFIQKTNLPEKFFLAVGTIEPRKNYETLIQAFAMIRQLHPNHHLLIAGKQGWGSENLEELIRENYLQKYVHFLGYVTNKTLNKLYNLAEALIFPSYYEGFGIPPLEAMQAGCPVISSHSSSMPEVIGDAAIFCDPSSPAEFAKAMETLLSSPSLRLDLVNKGRIQSKKFSWAASAQKLYTLIKTL